MSYIARTLFILFIVTATSCATVKAPGETQADPDLKKTVTNVIKQLELSYHCSTLKLIVTDTRITKPFDGKRTQEKWSILSCNGENHLYEVNYIISPKGGTDVEIRKWSD